MSNVSHRSDLSGHPDVDEMRERHDRVMSGGGRGTALADAPVFLLGIYCAVSPWVLHFTASQPALVTHNLVIGIAIAVLALCFTAMPERMTGMSIAICALGAWLIVSPWIVGSSPDMGVILNNVIVGGLAVVLGAVCAGLAVMNKKT
ncbi:SPW repeat protein [Streptomyces sp. NBC_00887]|uniref:SPW repeat protein n=1 Tax=Streptomyces sp. NBC_00887 TaxID=2975859 RepID=UPI0038678862|nr:SPW repeat protein [Streptomyces sp. NBC_00887]WSY35221.1 SPW repeat protein [Streptomyces sp. NBC_00887]